MNTDIVGCSGCCSERSTPCSWVRIRKISIQATSISIFATRAGGSFRDDRRTESSEIIPNQIRSTFALDTATNSSIDRRRHFVSHHSMPPQLILIPLIVQTNEKIVDSLLSHFLTTSIIPSLFPFRSFSFSIHTSQTKAHHLISSHPSSHSFPFPFRSFCCLFCLFRRRHSNLPCNSSCCNR